MEVLPSIYPLLDGLAETIKEETSILSGLTELFTAERNLMITGDVEAFCGLTKKKQRLQKELTSVVEIREKAIGDLCDAHSTNRDDVRLRELIEASLGYDDPRAHSLTALLDDYQSAAETLAEAGLRTQELMNRSVEYVDNMVKMIARINNPSSTYSSNGAMKAGVQSYGSKLSAQL